MQSSGERTGGWALSQADAKGDLVALLVNQYICATDDLLKECA